MRLSTENVSQILTPFTRKNRSGSLISDYNILRILIIEAMLCISHRSKVVVFFFLLLSFL